MVAARSPQSESSYDVLIIGGGPAGATAALLLARAGISAVVLEKSPFPRFHIGESLLPRNYSLLKELGLLEAVERAPHIPKYGAEFGMAGGTVTTRFSFDTGFFPGGRTFNIERSVFDKAILDEARAAGAVIREDANVREILSLADGDVRLRLADGQELSGKWLFDCSGQNTVVARHLGTRASPTDRHLQKVGYFAHFENVKRLTGDEEGHPLIGMADEGWFWLIPINDRVTSVGFVTHPEMSAQLGVASERMLAWAMDRSPLIQDRCANATGPRNNKVVSNFSYRCDPFAGPGYFLIGDAAAFVDPIFSTGVCLGMMEAQRACGHVIKLLKGEGTPAAARRDYIAFATGSTSIFFDMIRQFYTHEFRELFLHGVGPHRVHSAVLSVLAGHVFPRPPFALRWRMWLFRAFLKWHKTRPLVPPKPTFSMLSAHAEQCAQIALERRALSEAGEAREVAMSA